MSKFPTEHKAAAEQAVKTIRRVPRYLHSRCKNVPTLRSL